MKPPLSKTLLLAALAAMAKGAGRPPSRREFLAHSGLSEGAVLRYFPTWSAALHAAGLSPYTRNRRIDDRELLEEWGRVVRKNRRAPSRRTFRHLGKFDHRTIERRFGRWSQLPEVFRQFAQAKLEWADVLNLLPAPQRVAQLISPVPLSSPNKSAAPVAQPILAVHSSPPPCKFRHSPLPNRPTFGKPIDFRGLRYEPVNELGVVLLFGMIALELGYRIEALQSGFPDCEAQRQVAPHRWQRVHIEFEFESRNFRDHGHPLIGCDVIVCWRHNWPGCPAHLEILELSQLLPALPASHD